MLTWNVGLDPQENQIEEAYMAFVKEFVTYFRDIHTMDGDGENLADDDARLDIGHQEVKLCVLSKPNTRVEQTLGIKMVK